MRLLLPLLALGVAACTSPAARDPLRPGAARLPASLAATVVRQCSRPQPAMRTGWTPDAATLVRLEADLPHLATRTRGVRFAPETFDPLASQRQYVGLVTPEGRRLVYVNASPMPRADGRGPCPTPSAPCVVCDGGPSFWGVLYDPATRAFEGLAFNGHA